MSKMLQWGQQAEFGKSLSNKVIGKSASLKGEYDLEIHENETVKLLCTKDKKDGIVMGTI